MVRPIFASLVAMLLVAWTGAALADVPWVSEFEKIVAAPARGKEAVALLERLPLADRQSADHQWALARAAQAANLAGAAAEAVATYDTFHSSPPRDLGPVRSWLIAKGKELYGKAMASHGQGDLKGAVTAYLVAVKCDPSVLGKDDKGLREIANRALDKLVAKRPERVDLRFTRAFYSYLFGDLSAASTALSGYVQAERDPYKLWRARTWLARIGGELASARAADAASAAASRSGPVSRSTDRDLSVGDVGRNDDRKAKAEAESRRREIEDQIKAVDKELEELEKYKRGKVEMKNGEPVLVAYNQKDVAERRAKCNEEKSRLQAELDGLR